MTGRNTQATRTPRIRTFRERLREDLKDPKFRRYFEQEKRALALAMKMAEVREKAALTQKELARRVGSSQQTVSRLESGEYERYSLKTLQKIADATGHTLKIDFKPRKNAKVAGRQE